MKGGKQMRKLLRESLEEESGGIPDHLGGSHVRTKIKTAARKKPLRVLKDMRLNVALTSPVTPDPTATTHIKTRVKHSGSARELRRPLSLRKRRGAGRRSW